MIDDRFFMFAKYARKKFIESSFFDDKETESILNKIIKEIFEQKKYCFVSYTFDSFNRMNLIAVKLIDIGYNADWNFNNSKYTLYIYWGLLPQEIRKKINECKME
jgi:hypothetical protein